jgi:hypothetical protein
MQARLPRRRRVGASPYGKKMQRISKNPLLIALAIACSAASLALGLAPFAEPQTASASA